ncbi:hypothetical protein [Brevibacterium ammoniilyticum]|uniref:hypothetical protein n=1 Tax=Brevibacterium ammoniilyticum TaxID=1046555 RepID=UPI003139008A
MNSTEDRQGERNLSGNSSAVGWNLVGSVEQQSNQLSHIVSDHYQDEQVTNLLNEYRGRRRRQLLWLYAIVLILFIGIILLILFVWIIAPNKFADDNEDWSILISVMLGIYGVLFSLYVWQTSRNLKLERKIDKLAEHRNFRTGGMLFRHGADGSIHVVNERRDV